MKHAHYCPDWDHMWIDTGHPEIDCCNCKFDKDYKLRMYCFIVDGNICCASFDKTELLALRNPSNNKIYTFIAEDNNEA